MKTDISLSAGHRLRRWSLALGVSAAFTWAWSARAVESAVLVPAPSADVPAGSDSALQTAVLAGGCFWGVQGVFQHVAGVKSAVSGYAGGAADTADYDAVGSGTTGHAEAVRIVFDPKRISFGSLLQIYFSVAHDPTELNRQGPDHGTQYRSAIFPMDAAQEGVAHRYIDQLDRAHAFGAPIVTTVEPKQTFHPAEAYHQDFLALNPRYPYIVVNDLPKVENLKRLFPAAYRAKPVLVEARR